MLRGRGLSYSGLQNTRLVLAGEDGFGLGGLSADGTVAYYGHTGSTYWKVDVMTDQVLEKVYVPGAGWYMELEGKYLLAFQGDGGPALVLHNP